jgi:serine/threonine protein kinase
MPFARETTGATFGAILHEAPISVTELNPKVLPRLQEIIDKSLEKDRNLRYQHASEIRSDLQRLKRDSEPGQLPGADSVPTIPKSRTQWRAIAPVVAILIVGLVIAIWLTRAQKVQALSATDTVVLGDFTNTTGGAASTVAFP